jgi:hypothetical protein
MIDMIKIFNEKNYNNLPEKVPCMLYSFDWKKKSRQSLNHENHSSDI